MLLKRELELVRSGNKLQVRSLIDWLHNQQSGFVPIVTDRPEQEWAMGRSCHLYRLLALQPQG